MIGEDARELERLLDNIYLYKSNYKWQGLPFWVCLACVEFAILDLLGRSVGKPVAALMGEILQTEIPVYYASGNRGDTPEDEI